MMALLIGEWVVEQDDGPFQRQRTTRTGDTRVVVPAPRIRRLYPWSKPKF